MIRIYTAIAVLAAASCISQPENIDKNQASNSYVCGDGVCFVAERQAGNCPEDCSAGAPVCGNGVCSDAERDSGLCVQDCGTDDPDVNNAPVDVPPCIYPEAGSFVEYNKVHPNIGWEGAYLQDGSRVDFTMEKWLCNEEYQEFDTVAFVLGTGWCPACPRYIEHVDRQSAALYANGMMIVYVEAQDSNFDAATNEFAYEFIGSHIGEGRGLRVGDGETLPTPGILIQSPVVQAFPSAWIVRRSDLTVIASQSHSEYILRFEDISQDPDSAEWTGRPSTEANCGPDEEEIYEGQNDDPGTAPIIELGSFTGGICADGPDYYRVDIMDSWQIDLEFTHDVGDLDIYLWDLNTGDVAKDENSRAIGSDSVSDNEHFEWSGPATFFIVGYEYDTTAYRLTLSRH